MKNSALKILILEHKVKDIKIKFGYTTRLWIWAIGDKVFNQTAEQQREAHILLDEIYEKEIYGKSLINL